jgi:acylphosphatase
VPNNYPAFSLYCILKICLFTMTTHVIIKGKVQGVFFRATAKEVADKIGVSGWVRNTPEGDVEAVASGSEEQVNAFIEWCRKGPRSAVVTNVETRVAEDQQFTSFQILRKS